MLQLSYLSTATRELELPDLLVILRGARERNASHQVTGVLAYAQGSFFQTLEGEEAAVRSALARLSTDRRHHALKVIDEREVQSREFSEWHMGLASGQPVSEPGLTVGRDAFTGFVNGLKAPVAKIFLKQFLRLG